jgi:hypothetical protein
MMAVLKAGGACAVAFVIFVVWYFIQDIVTVSRAYYKAKREEGRKARPPIALMLALILMAGVAQAADLTLYWNASPSTNVGGYKLYWGTASRAYTSTQDCGNVLEKMVSGIGTNKNTFFALTAYNVSGNESVFSAEAVWDAQGYLIKPLPPGKPSFRDVLKAWFKKWFNV